VEIIPAIDIRDGRCVRLFQGDFAQETIYGDSPLDVAQEWLVQGATRLHLVDLDGARSGAPVHAELIGTIAKALPIPLQVGGGIRTEADIELMLSQGVARVILGTAAVRDPALVERMAKRFGDAVIVGVDARDGLVATAGWLETATVRSVDLVSQMTQAGVQRFIYTDIARDGTLTEPNYRATGELIRADGPAVIASGGIAGIEQLLQLARIGCEGAIVGRALYTNAIRLPDALRALSATEFV
jgi:phosphoribosylformimino-5-aminoimidazole carboxamide ribotide isomerase